MKVDRTWAYVVALFGVLGLALWWATADDSTTDDGEVAAAAVEAGAGPKGKRPPRSRPDTPALDTSGSISGRVTTPDGSPIAKADVCARTRDDGLGSAEKRVPLCTKSRADGTYRLGNLYRVRWSVGAAAPGHLPAQHGQDKPRFPGVRLDAEQNVTGIDIVLQPGGVEIKGVVKDLGGGVIEEAWVSSNAGRWGRFARNWGAVTRTDAEGKFTLWVKEGDVTVSAQADGYSSGDDTGVAPGTEFTVVLTPESVIEGIVQDEAGTPVAGAKVTASASFFSAGGSALSDENGRYRIDGLEPGRYKPNATADGAYGQAGESVRLGIGETVGGVDVVVHPAALVRASVVTEDGAPCERGSLSISDAKTQADVRGEVTRGSVELKAVRPGHYDVSVSCVGWLAKESYPELDVADENITDLVYTVAPGESLQGVVLNADGKPVEGASVNAVGDSQKGGGSPGGFAKTNADGAFDFVGMRAGAYKVSVWADGVPNPKEPIPVEVPRTEPLTITLEAGGTVKGRVTDDKGQPVGGVTVQARGSGRETAHVADDGTYTLSGLRAGTYRVTAQSAWWGDALRKPGSSDDDKQGESVEVVAGETVEVDLVVEARDGEIAGTVVDEAGGPLGDAYVSVTRQSDSATAGKGRAMASSRWTWGTDPILSDVDGSFTAKGLSDGTYTLRAYRKGGGEGFVEDIAVGSTSVEIRIAVEGSLAGTVTPPPERFKVSVRDPKSAFSRSEDFIRTEGAWAMRELPAGTFDVVISAAEGIAEHKGVKLAAGEDVDGLAAELAGLGTVRGRVVDLDTGEPVVGVVVRAMKSGGRMQFRFDQKHGKELTDKDGRYEVEQCPTGKVTLRVWPAAITEMGTFGVGAILVDVESGKTTDAPDIKLVSKRVGRGEAEGDLGFKTNSPEMGAEPQNHPKVVGFVREGGPAEKAGLEVGNTIVKVNGHDVTGANISLFRALTRVKEGTTVELGLDDGTTVKITAGP